MKKEQSKPIIETLINTIALALTAWGVIAIQQGNLEGYITILFGMGLEFFKYWGRKEEYW